MGVTRAEKALAEQRTWFAERRRHAFAQVPRAGRRLIIEEDVTFISRGSRYHGRLAVAQPVAVDTYARCVVELEGWWAAVAITGEWPLQALMLGLRHLAFGLHDAEEKGMKIVIDGIDGAEWAKLNFGPLFESPKAAMARSKRRERAEARKAPRSKRVKSR